MMVSITLRILVHFNILTCKVFMQFIIKLHTVSHQTQIILCKVTLLYKYNLLLHIHKQILLVINSKYFMHRNLVGDSENH